MGVLTALHIQNVPLVHVLISSFIFKYLKFCIFDEERTLSTHADHINPDQTRHFSSNLCAKLSCRPRPSQVAYPDWLNEDHT